MFLTSRKATKDDKKLANKNPKYFYDENDTIKYCDYKKSLIPKDYFYALVQDEEVNCEDFVISFNQYMELYNKKGETRKAVQALLGETEVQRLAETYDTFKHLLLRT
jgi:hypothetical protein